MREVLLRGYLDLPKIERVESELMDATAHGETRMLFDTESDGGDVSPMIRLISRLKRLEQERFVFVHRIGKVRSAAALFVLSVGLARTMSKNGLIGLHRGSILLEAADFDHATGQISRTVLNEVQKYDAFLKSTVTKYGLDKDTRRMAGLFGRGWLVLGADECLKLGIVQGVF